MFKELDKAEKGRVEYKRILGIVLGRMSKDRRQLVDAAFSLIDKDNDGVIDRDDIARAFESWKHPDAKSGKRRADDILHDVLEVLDNTTALHRGVKTDGRYTREEFASYFECISACTPSEEDFENAFTTLWRVDKSKLPLTEEKKVEKEAVKKVVETDEEQDE
eukprot:TRINITY_DN1340_c0_g2_i2.p2 TRINITY_DN1340_c0_g2~~TRINITY_DN1340_c0_g2_i2.p2  ORF type:complete len:163 (+),score=38.84 TRINITY_DN1340_c0_g2_i2:221-709(+)